MTNYASAAKRIRACKNEFELKQVEILMTRLYNAGMFTVNEFSRLDGLVVDQYVKFEN